MTVQKRLKLVSFIMILALLITVSLTSYGVSLQKNLLSSEKIKNSSILDGQKANQEIAQSLNLFNSAIVMTMLADPDIAHKNASLSIDFMKSGVDRLDSTIAVDSFSNVGKYLISQIEAGSKIIYDDDSYGASELFRDSIKPVSDSLFLNFDNYLSRLIKKQSENSNAMSKKYTIMQYFFFFLIILSMIILVLVFFRIIKHIGSGIDNLLDSTVQFHGGNYLHRADVNGEDEFAKLAISMNSMFSTTSEHEEIQQSQLEDLNSLFVSISESSNNVKYNAEQLDSISSNVSQNALELTAELKEISDNIEFIKSKSIITAEKSEETQNVSLSSSESASIGKLKIDTLTNSMSEINSAMTEISSIVNLISEITMQTDILAINAAVEAARAGNNGKGFAVVADEVRELAQKSSKATLHISTLVDDIASKINRSNDDVVEVSNSIENIVAKISTIIESSKLAKEIAIEENRAVTNTNNKIEAIYNLAQKLTASSEESASASEELLQEASALSNLAR